MNFGLTDEVIVKIQYQLASALDDLLLPYTIDLSLFEKIENKELIEHINRVGLPFYSK